MLAVVPAGGSGFGPVGRCAEVTAGKSAPNSHARPKLVVVPGPAAPRQCGVAGGGSERGRADDGAAAQIGEREGVDSVAAVSGPNQTVQGCIVGDLEQSPVCRQVIRGREIAGEGHDLAQNVMGRSTAVPAWKIPETQIMYVTGND